MIFIMDNINAKINDTKQILFLSFFIHKSYEVYVMTLILRV